MGNVTMPSRIIRGFPFSVKKDNGCHGDENCPPTKKMKTLEENGVHIETNKSCDKMEESCDQTNGSCDKMPESCDKMKESCDQTNGSCDKMEESCDQTNGSCDKPTNGAKTDDANGLWDEAKPPTVTIGVCTTIHFNHTH